MNAITLLIAALATARITRLFTRDMITHALRRRILLRLDADGLPAYLMVCDWCMSMYVAAGVVAVVIWGGTVGWWILAALAFSHVAGWLASKEGE